MFSGIPSAPNQYGPGQVYNITNKTAETLLNVNDWAILTINSSATTNWSQPLRIATVPGLYELHFQYQAITSSAAFTYSLLQPNNSASTGSTVYVSRMSGNSTTPFASLQNGTTGFYIGSGQTIMCNAIISTLTNSKTVTCDWVAWDTTQDMYRYSQFWSDTTTPWTSLGTIYYDYGQVGTIYIHRLI